MIAFVSGILVAALLGAHFGWLGRRDTRWDEEDEP